MTTCVQSKTSGNLNGNPVTFAYTSNVTQGNLLVVVVGNSTTFNVTSISDSGNGNWNIQVNGIGPDPGSSRNKMTWAWVVAKATGPCTVNVNGSGSFTNMKVSIAEYNGVNTLRNADAGVTGGGSTIRSGNITSVAGDLLIMAFTDDNGNSTTSSYINGLAIRTNFVNSWEILADNLSSPGGTLQVGMTTSFSVNSGVAGGSFYYVSPGDIVTLAGEYDGVVQ